VQKTFYRFIKSLKIDFGTVKTYLERIAEGFFRAQTLLLSNTYDAIAIIAVKKT